MPEFALFISIKEYDATTGEGGLGELKENYLCISPENVEMTGDMAFSGYIEENGERVGVQILCDPGFVNAAGNAPLLAEIRLGGRYKFAHTERANGSAVGRIRGYSLKLYEAGHEHDHGHDHGHEHDHEHEHGGGCGCGHEHHDDCDHDCEHCDENR
ncbi:MAG: hypothetical protein IKI64_03495 [Clostridia bacterium]|nr:hypothetical protein [Clostridia bacterium]